MTRLASRTASVRCCLPTAFAWLHRGKAATESILFSLTLCSCLAAGAGSSCAFASDQPQWGQAWSRNMVSGEKGLPDSFDPKTGGNVKWVAGLGTETHSTPVVAGGRVYLGTNNGEPRDPRHQGDRGVLMCFEEKTGRLLDRKSVV